MVCHPLAGLRRRPDPCLRHGQVPLRSPLVSSSLLTSPNFPTDSTLSSFPKNQMKLKQTSLTSLCTNDTHHSSLLLIRPTILGKRINSPDPTMPPPPPSPLKMPNPRTGVDDGAFFKAARRTTIAMVFSLERRREGGHGNGKEGAPSTAIEMGRPPPRSITKIY